MEHNINTNFNDIVLNNQEYNTPTKYIITNKIVHEFITRIQQVINKIDFQQ